MYSPLSKGYEKKDFQKVINSNTIGVLAVSDEVWSVQATTIFYAVEDENTLLFKSHVTSNHGKQMQITPKVVLAIFLPDSTYTEKTGVQLRCICEKITDYKEMEKAVSIYSKTFQGAEQRFASIEELISPEAKSTLFRLKIMSGKMLSPSGYSETFQDFN